MFDLSRRDLLVSGAAVTVVSAGAPAQAVAQAAGAAAPQTAAWDLRDLFPSDAAWEAERQSLLEGDPEPQGRSGKARPKRGGAEGRVPGGSDANRRASRLYTYASLKADEDRRVAVNQERKQQAQDVFTAIGEATAWAARGGGGWGGQRGNPR